MSLKLDFAFRPMYFIYLVVFMERAPVSQNYRNIRSIKWFMSLKLNFGRCPMYFMYLVIFMERAPVSRNYRNITIYKVVYNISGN